MKRMLALFFVIYSSIIVPATPLSYPFKKLFYRGNTVFG